jgi:hypothetical protein
MESRASTKVVPPHVTPAPHSYFEIRPASPNTMQRILDRNDDPLASRPPPVAKMQPTRILLKGRSVWKGSPLEEHSIAL